MLTGGYETRGAVDGAATGVRCQRHRHYYFFVPQGRVAEKGGEGDGVVVALVVVSSYGNTDWGACVCVRERVRVCMCICLRVCL